MKKILFVLIFCILLLSSISFAKEFPDVASTYWAHQYISELSDQGVINGYEDGTFRPNGTVTYAEFLKLMVCSDYYRSSFAKFAAGSEGNWYDIYFSMADDIVTYNYDRTPNKPISRLEMAKIILDFADYDRILHFKNVDITNTNMFNDTKGLADMDIKVLSTIKELGIITGYEDNSFRPSNNMTRAEVATIMYRYKKLLRGE